MSRPVAVVTSTIPLTIHTFHRELLRQLDEAGYDVLVVSSPGELLDRLEATPRVRTAVIRMTREISPAADLAALGHWLRLMRAERPALVVTATPKASLLGQLAALVVGTPRRAYYLGGLRLQGETGARRRLLTWMERLTAACAHVVIPNSPSLAREALDNRLTAHRKIRPIEPASSHGVDSTHFAPRAPDEALRSGLGLDPVLPVVGFIGRVTADKGIESLISALHVLTAAGRDLQVLVLGSQTEGDAQTWLQRLRLESRVVTVGHTDDIRPYVSLMDVHVLPSRREGFPNVVLETAAMQVPTVTTRGTGAVDSVRDGETGILVDVDVPDQLARAIAALLDDPQQRRRLGLNARRVAVSDFQPRVVVASFVRQILGETPALDPR